MNSPVVLKRIEEFRAVLKNYEPSDTALKILEPLPLVILLGITGSGRNTIINHLLDTKRYHFIVSDTTRPPKFRDGKMEQNGVQYHFRSEDAVLEDLKKGLFLEAEVLHNQQVSGISVRELERAHNSKKIPITEVDIEGTVNIAKAKPDTKMFFIVPPSYAEWIQRLKLREEMSQQELQNRTETAIRVLRAGLDGKHFSFVINNYSHESAQLIDEQVTSQPNFEHDQATRKVAQTILNDIENHLASR